MKKKQILVHFPFLHLFSNNFLEQDIFKLVSVFCKLKKSKTEGNLWGTKAPAKMESIFYKTIVSYANFTVPTNGPIQLKNLSSRGQVILFQKSF